mmetsp:Transcript_7689/g.15804  ORF Transcript_7689/g.15804 Transcript_7689/m.15804 type:complete len:249 (+) Transcript_7689:69-815(+)
MYIISSMALVWNGVILRLSLGSLGTRLAPSVSARRFGNEHTGMWNFLRFRFVFEQVRQQSLLFCLLVFGRFHLARALLAPRLLDTRSGVLRRLQLLVVVGNGFKRARPNVCRAAKSRRGREDSPDRAQPQDLGPLFGQCLSDGLHVRSLGDSVRPRPSQQILCGNGQSGRDVWPDALVKDAFIVVLVRNVLVRLFQGQDLVRQHGKAVDIGLEVVGFLASDFGGHVTGASDFLGHQEGNVFGLLFLSG